MATIHIRNAEDQQWQQVIWTIAFYDHYGLFKMIDITCVVAATLFEISNVIFFVFYAKYRNRSHFDYQTFTQLDPSYIQEEWEFRFNNRSLELASGIINALAWLVLAMPILQAAWIQSNRGKRQLGIHVGIAVLALGGCGTSQASEDEVQFT